MRSEKRNILLSIALGALLLVGAGCERPEGLADTKPNGNEAISGTDESVSAGDEKESDEDDKVDASDATAKNGEDADKEDEADDGKEDDAATKPGAGSSAVTAAIPSADVKVFKIVGNKFSFTPSEIRVKMGDKVRIEVTSDDDDHGIAIPAFNVNVKFAPGKPAVAEFVADKKGSYPFFCSVFCGSGHRDMKGTLIVE